MAHRQVQKQRRPFSNAPQIIGRHGRQTREAESPASAGDWYLVVRSIEHNGVCYLPLNHHLIESNTLPAQVPSNGANSKDKNVPVDASGRINLIELDPRALFKLYKSGAITPIDAAKSYAKLMEGRRMAKTTAVQMIPPIRRVSNLAQSYQQATNVPLTIEGMQNLTLAQATLPNPFLPR